MFTKSFDYTVLFEKYEVLVPIKGKFQAIFFESIYENSSCRYNSQ